MSYQGHWFSSISIPFGTDMISIIGNKGNGKSALADIIALAGNSHCPQESFSFLKKDRFLDPKNRYRDAFEVSLRWLDGTENQVCLTDKSDKDTIEKVKYLPQSFLESLCASKDDTEFQKELKKVIFNHTDPIKRFDKTSFDELLDHKTEETELLLAEHKVELSQVNQKIIALQKRLSVAYSKFIQSQLDEKERALKNHDTKKPTVVDKPEFEMSSQGSEELNQLKESRESLKLSLDTSQKNKQLLFRKLDKSSKLKGRLNILEKVISKFKSDNAADASELGIDLEDLISFQINSNILLKVVEDLNQENHKCDEVLDEQSPESIASKLRVIENSIQEEQAKLSAPQRKYEQYLKNNEMWEKERELIIGNIDDSGQNTINYFKQELSKLEDVYPTQLEELRLSRDEKVRQIHSLKLQQKEMYEEVFEPVQEIISENSIVKEKMRLLFQASLEAPDFSEVFFSKINLKRKSEFAGEEGESRLQALIDNVDFQDQTSVVNFCNEVLSCLFKSQNFDDIEKLLRKHTSIQELYDFVYALGYISPEYYLSYGEKPLRLLSPGERGTLLLIFESVTK